MHKLKVRKIGSSLGVILPVEILQNLHVGEGDELSVVLDHDGAKLTPHDPVFEDGMKAFESFRKRYRNALRKLAE